MNAAAFPPAPPARILIVDDERQNVAVLRRALGLAGYADLHSTTEPREAVALFGAVRPDLVLLDLRMPFVDGFEVMRRLGPLIPADSHLPVLVLTADVVLETRRRALAAGATDFLNKPFDIVELALRVRNLLRARFLAQDLEARVRERTRDLEASRVDLVERLAAAAEYRDDDTGQHTRRVGDLAARLAAELGLPAAEVAVLRQAAPLHDVGKIAIPDAVLLKPGRFTPEEFAAMKAHAEIGGRLLAGASFPVMQVAETVARTHHERWDGSGYPAGLAGRAIPLVGRIVAVADVFDALTHARPYKPAWGAAEAADEIRKQSGRHFDPDVVAALDRCLAPASADGVGTPAPTA